ncbi:unnamed protein product [Eruca vesicaria subsp. sativa]|uniref:Pectinesterase inhibitor domain-containing protein n=1 Tax=Eruca vesicaria subsp. sativa TaxID=29727 RepID=A0ABC8JNH0_ERUVS|nr:unnamed protein product [Eruca vesicaria subsp. sativa]
MVANNKLIILVLLISLLPHIIFTSASAQEFDTKAYVDSWCQETKYQKLCVRSLTPFVRSRTIQIPEELVLFALKESLNLANNTTAFLLKELANRETRTVYKNEFLRISVHRLKNISGRLSNLVEEVGRRNGFDPQTWRSTLLTEGVTLVSEFQGRRLSKLEATIKEKVKNVEETTSNALALIKHYAGARH